MNPKNIKDQANFQMVAATWQHREKLREKGQFWTPDWVANAMAEYIATDIDVVCDPAVGEGAMIRALLKINSVLRCYGFDIDDTVLDSPVFKHQNVLVEKRDFLLHPPQCTFKAIIGNPPYIRHHRIHEKIKLYLRHLTQKITGHTLDGRAGYHVYFLIQALHLLEREGKLAFILPADTCEGVFAGKLWQWITKNYCLECVITFSHEATPFPNLDINPLIVFIRHQQPKDEFVWAKVVKRGVALQQFVQSNFQTWEKESIDVSTRTLHEALSLGLSREPRQYTLSCASSYMLSDFATVMRGIATGANEFFFLSNRQIEALDIPMQFFRRTVGRTRDIAGDTITLKDLDELDAAGRPTFLLTIEQPFETLPISLQKYLQYGIELGLTNRSLIRTRKPWYKMEKRVIPEILFAYLGRRNTRFIKNQADVIPLHCLHCVNTYSKDPYQINSLWYILNHPDTLSALNTVSKSYGSGALKAEPRNLAKLPIPEHLVEMYGLIPKSRTLPLID
jgi:methylase of polypeptide subunit release factors